MNYKRLKNKVIQWRTHGQVKKGNLLAISISAYERGRITLAVLIDNYNQIWRM